MFFVLALVFAAFGAGAMVGVIGFASLARDADERRALPAATQRQIQRARRDSRLPIATALAPNRRRQVIPIGPHVRIDGDAS